MSWREITLGDFLEIKHGWAFKSQYFGEVGEHIVMTPGNFFERGGFRSRPGKDRFYTVEPPSGFVLRPGDLVIAMTEQGEGLLGSSALVPVHGSYLHNQRIGLVENLDENRLHKGFLYRLFNTAQIRGEIRSTASGTKVRHTAPARIRQIKARVPSVHVQRRIADILSAYDDLIENNRRRIALLEEAARLLYREWFVHFRFPGHEHVRIVDGVPQGWERRSLGDITSTNQGTYSKGGLPNEINYIDISSVDRGRVLSKQRLPAPQAPGRARRKVRDGDIIWSNVRPNLRAYALLLEPDESDVVSTGFTVLSAKKVPFTWLYGAVTTEQFVQHLVNHATGVGYPAVRADDYSRAVLPVPPTTLLAHFHESVEPSLRLVSNMDAQNSKLDEVRDLLLPRLMAGEIAIS